MFSIQSNKCIAHKTLGSINQIHDFVNTLIIPCPNISLSLTGLSSVSFEVFSAIVFKKKVKFVHAQYDNTLGLFSDRFGLI